MKTKESLKKKSIRLGLYETIYECWIGQRTPEDALVRAGLDRDETVDPETFARMEKIVDESYHKAFRLENPGEVVMLLHQTVERVLDEL